MSLRRCLQGKRGLVIGIASQHSMLRRPGLREGAARASSAELAIAWLNEEGQPHVQAPLADQVEPLNPNS